MIKKLAVAFLLPLLLLLAPGAAHAAYVDATFRINTSATPDVPIPAGVQADDVCFWSVTYDSTSQLFEPTDWGNGFTQLTEGDITAPSDGQAYGLAWKRLTTGETGSWTFTGAVGSSAQFTAQAICFRGRHTTNAPAFDITVSNAANTSPVSAAAPALTALCGDDLLAILIPDVSVSGVFDSPTMPSGFTDRETNENGFYVMSMATKESVAAGSTGTPTFAYNLTSGNSGFAAINVRVPAAGACSAGLLLLRRRRG